MPNSRFKKGKAFFSIYKQATNLHKIIQLTSMHIDVTSERLTKYN